MYSEVRASRGLFPKSALIRVASSQWGLLGKAASSHRVTAGKGDGIFLYARRYFLSHILYPPRPQLIGRNLAFQAEIHLQIEEGWEGGKQTETKDLVGAQQRGGGDTQKQSDPMTIPTVECPCLLSCLLLGGGEGQQCSE